MNKGRQKNIFIALLAILIVLLLVAIFFTVSSIMDFSKKTEEIKVVEGNKDDNPEPDKDKVVPAKDKDKDKEKDNEEKSEEKPKNPVDKNKDNEDKKENNEEKNNNEPTDKNEDEKEPKEENTQVSSGSVFVNTDSLNVRAEASTDSTIVANVSQGSELYVLGSSNGWINVQVAPGLTGYVSKEYVTGGENLENNNDGEINQGSNATVTGDSVAVRMEANTNSDIVIYVNQGDSLEILDSQGDWYYVRLSNGFLGYIHKDYVG